MTAVIQEQAARVITVTGQEGGRPAVFENPAAAHQIRIRSRFRSGYGRCTEIIVTCTCLRRQARGQMQGVIAARPGLFPAAEAIAAYRDWHARQGIEVAS